MVAAINRIAAFDFDIGSYGSASTAYSIGVALKKVAALTWQNAVDRRRRK